MTNPFTREERRIITEAISFAMDEIGPYGDMDLADVGAHQESYTWDECLTILNVLGNHPDSKTDWLGKRDWYTTQIKLMLLAINTLRDYRIQKCHQKVGDKECTGYLIFFDASTGLGKVAVTSLLPSDIIEKLETGYTEGMFGYSMFGYIIAICPTCHHVQLYGVPRCVGLSQGIGRPPLFLISEEKEENDAPEE